MSQAALDAIATQIGQRDARYDSFAELLMAVERSISSVVAQQMQIFGSSGRA